MWTDALATPLEAPKLRRIRDFPRINSDLLVLHAANGPTQEKEGEGFLRVVPIRTG